MDRQSCKGDHERVMSFLEAGDLLEDDTLRLDADDVSCLLTCLSPLRRDAEEDESDDTSVDTGSNERFMPSDSALLEINGELAAETELLDTSLASLLTEESTAEDCKPPRRSDSNKARNERRREVLRLRQTVAHMEQELSALKMQTELSRKRSHEASQPEGRLLAPWQTIAEHQLKERRRVEDENVRLRVEVDTQMQIARRLERLVRQSMRQRSLEACGIETHEDDAKVPRFNDPSVYDALMHEMELRYQNIDALFDRLGINNMEYSHHGTRVYRRDFGMEMEMFRNDVLPVPLDTAGVAVWKQFAQNMARVPYRHYYERKREVVFTNQDTFLENIGFELHYNGKSANFRVQQVLRRFVEDDRVVIMWSSKLHTVEYSEGPMTGTIFHRNGCMLFKRPRALNPNELCIFKMSNVFTPVLDGSNLNPGGSMIKELTEFLLGEGAASAEFTHQLIENMLLREVMRTKRPQISVS
ncbi:hypothetical protein Poli38472_000482 [Pythium oligandrum]|uniref:M96 mating-specific protein family n=1 Tax=Pythium oligandrum TaxID=41045 RepID=A0A8K1CCT2_PYTOL|nr:hypothetical protein Poli38472_000482 [Pythium oligandrum]|eukprot:TMW60440.1 hypothetical protein Poli38472_000482 [Pythium oligandrum]